MGPPLFSDGGFRRKMPSVSSSCGLNGAAALQRQRGWRWQHETPSGSLNGAAALQRRRARRRAREMEKGQGLNGAAALQRRRGIGGRCLSRCSVNCLNGAAALRRRRGSTARGNMRCQRTQSQWGRRSSATEGPPRAVHRTILETSQWGPPLFGDGGGTAVVRIHSECMTSQWGRRSSATGGSSGSVRVHLGCHVSMGPPLFSDGRVTARSSSPACSRSLNGAAALQRRRALAARGITRWCNRLNGAAALQRRRVS